MKDKTEEELRMEAAQAEIDEMAKAFEEETGEPVKAIPFNTMIMSHLTHSITLLHNLVMDVTQRSDLMAQVVNKQQDRIAKLEEALSEKDNSC